MTLQTCTELVFIFKMTQTTSCKLIKCKTIPFVCWFPLSSQLMVMMLINVCRLFQCQKLGLPYIKSDWDTQVWINFVSEKFYGFFTLQILLLTLIWQWPLCPDTSSFDSHTDSVLKDQVPGVYLSPLRWSSRLCIMNSLLRRYSLALSSCCFLSSLLQYRPCWDDV